MGIQMDYLRMDKRRRREQGSAVIEAVVCLTIFIVAILTVLSFINICRAQAAVSDAVDAAAKEMSQYAYFYHLVGLEDLQKTQLANTQESRDKIEAIAGGTEAIYAVFKDLGSNDFTGEKVSNSIQVALNTPKGSDSDVDKATATGVTMENAASKIGQMADAAAQIKDPIGFLKDVVKVALMEGSSFLRSQLIAAPLAEILTQKHFGENREEADAYLRTLKIDGMDALNFKMSTIFAPATPDDIHIVCYYRMKPINFFNFEMGDVTLCKEAVTRAWLGGDRLYSAAESSSTDIWSMPSLQYGKYIIAQEKKKLQAQNCYDSATAGVDSFNANTNTWIHFRTMDTYSETYAGNPDDSTNVKNIKNELLKEYRTLDKAASSRQDVIKVRDKEEKVELSSPRDTRKKEMVIIIPEGADTKAFTEALQQFKDETAASDPTFSVAVFQGYGKSPKIPQTP